MKAGPQGRLSRQEAVSTPHAQAQGAHAEVLRLLRLHRKVRKKHRRKFRLQAAAGASSHLKIIVFYFSPPMKVVDHQRQVGSKQPLPLLRKVLPNVALRCRRQQDGRILGLPLRRLWRI